MKTILLLSISFLAFSQSSNTFEVKELDHAKVSRLSAAEATYSQKMDVFKVAQAELEDAKADRDKAMSSAVTEFGSFEGDCVYPQHQGGATFAVMTYGSKKFKRVEIRGKYALISEGSESCGGGGITNTFTVGPASSFLSITPGTGVVIR